MRGRRDRTEFIELLVAETGTNPPDDQRAYLDKTLAAFRDTKTQQGSDLFKAMNEAISYSHRLLNFLLRAKGEANHTSRDFAKYHVFSSEGDD